MQNKYLNFYLKFSDKFHLKYFTTIRSLKTIKEKNLVVGDVVDILEERNFLFQAKIVSISVMNLNKLSPSDCTILMLDMEENWQFAADSIRYLCKSNIVAVVTLCKV